MKWSSWVLSKTYPRCHSRLKAKGLGSFEDVIVFDNLGFYKCDIWVLTHEFFFSSYSHTWRLAKTYRLDVQRTYYWNLTELGQRLNKTVHHNELHHTIKSTIQRFSPKPKRNQRIVFKTASSILLSTPQLLKKQPNKNQFKTYYNLIS